MASASVLGTTAGDGVDEDQHPTDLDAGQTRRIRIAADSVDVDAEHRAPQHEPGYNDHRKRDDDQPRDPEQIAVTTAELWLPVATAASDLAREQTVLSQETVEAAPLRILAVDDDALVLLNTAAMLEELGHTVAEAHSAAAALDLLEEQPFDLVITDHAMPKMTGLQLFDAIKEKWPNVPVIIATGFAELPGAREMKILNKPFTEHELASAIASSSSAV